MYKVVVDLSWGFRWDEWSSQKFFTREPTEDEIIKAYKEETVLTKEDFKLGGKVLIEEIEVEF